MLRIPFRQDFAIRFIFEDIDGFPVSLKDVPADFWLSTRQGGPTFGAFLRPDTSLNCMLLDDGSVLVNVCGHRLLPGKLKASIVINGTDVVSESCPGHHHFGDKFERPLPPPPPYGAPAHHHPNHCSNITLTPNVPVELVDAASFSNAIKQYDPSQPVIVHARFNIRRPSLQKHVTEREMNQAIDNAMEKFHEDKFADEQDVLDVTSMFNID